MRALVFIMTGLVLWVFDNPEVTSQTTEPRFNDEKQTKLKAVMTVFKQAQASNNENQMAVAFEDFAEELGGRAGKSIRRITAITHVYQGRKLAPG
jgi:predicted protein tyrosine phosphatase